LRRDARKGREVFSRQEQGRLLSHLEVRPREGGGGCTEGGGKGGGSEVEKNEFLLTRGSDISSGGAGYRREAWDAGEESSGGEGGKGKVRFNKFRVFWGKRSRSNLFI